MDPRRIRAREIRELRDLLRARKTAGAKGGNTTLDARALMNLADKLHAMAIDECNVEMTEHQAELHDARELRMRASVDRLVAPYNLRAEHNSDPRGYPVRVSETPGTPPVRGNSWAGGYGFGDSERWVR